MTSGGSGINPRVQRQDAYAAAYAQEIESILEAKASEIREQAERAYVDRKPTALQKSLVEFKEMLDAVSREVANIEEICGKDSSPKLYALLSEELMYADSRKDEIQAEVKAIEKLVLRQQVLIDEYDAKLETLEDRFPRVERDKYARVQAFVKDVESLQASLSQWRAQVETDQEEAEALRLALETPDAEIPEINPDNPFLTNASGLLAAKRALDQYDAKKEEALMLEAAFDQVHAVSKNKARLKEIAKRQKDVEVLVGFNPAHVEGSTAETIRELASRSVETSNCFGFGTDTTKELIKMGVSLAEVAKLFPGVDSKEGFELRLLVLNEAVAEAADAVKVVEEKLKADPENRDYLLELDGAKRALELAKSKVRGWNNAKAHYNALKSVLREKQEKIASEVASIQKSAPALASMQSNVIQRLATFAKKSDVRVEVNGEMMTASELETARTAEKAKYDQAVRLEKRSIDRNLKFSNIQRVRLAAQAQAERDETKVKELIQRIYNSAGLASAGGRFDPTNPSEVLAGAKVYLDEAKARMDFYEEVLQKKANLLEGLEDLRVQMEEAVARRDAIEGSLDPEVILLRNIIDKLTSKVGIEREEIPADKPMEFLVRIEDNAKKQKLALERSLKSLDPKSKAYKTKQLEIRRLESTISQLSFIRSQVKHLQAALPEIYSALNQITADIRNLQVQAKAGELDTNALGRINPLLDEMIATFAPYKDYPGFAELYPKIGTLKKLVTTFMVQDGVHKGMAAIAAAADKDHLLASAAKKKVVGEIFDDVAPASWAERKAELEEEYAFLKSDVPNQVKIDFLRKAKEGKYAGDETLIDDLYEAEQEFFDAIIEHRLQEIEVLLAGLETQSELLGRVAEARPARIAANIEEAGKQAQHARLNADRFEYLAKQAAKEFGLAYSFEVHPAVANDMVEDFLHDLNAEDREGASSDFAEMLRDRKDLSHGLYVQQANHHKQESGALPRFVRMMQGGRVLEPQSKRFAAMEQESIDTTGLGLLDRLAAHISGDLQYALSPNCRPESIDLATDNKEFVKQLLAQGIDLQALDRNSFAYLMYHAALVMADRAVANYSQDIKTALARDIVSGGNDNIDEVARQIENKISRLLQATFGVYVRDSETLEPEFDGLVYAVRPTVDALIDEAVKIQRVGVAV